MHIIPPILYSRPYSTVGDNKIFHVLSSCSRMHALQLLVDYYAQRIQVSAVSAGGRRMRIRFEGARVLRQEARTHPVPALTAD